MGNNHNGTHGKLINGLVGRHESIEKIRSLIDVVADTAFNVLITGETGTGKDVVARLLHARSPRNRERFVKVNCGALPGTLLESELFGYEKGAFTGADRRKPGRFELASRGVIMLDEIGDMPFPLQAKILEVLQSSSFHRLGGNHPVTVDAWVISCTNRDLKKEIQAGRFREDLFYRLNVIKIEIPPLRHRREDIPLLVKHLAALHHEVYGLSLEFQLTPDLRTLFAEYPWYGNVRELANIVLRLMAGEMPWKIHEEITRTWEAAEGNGNRATEPGPVPSQGVPGAASDGKPNHIPLMALKKNAERIIEQQAIQYALKTSGGNKRKAARILKVSYKTLYNKMAALDIYPVATCT
jgi:DNA-binding NtrC family response regulator